MVNAIRTVVALPDPVGQVVSGTVRPNGLLIEQVGSRSAWSPWSTRPGRT